MPRSRAPIGDDDLQTLVRISRRGELQMPPTSTNRVDTRGAALIEAWIKQLPPPAASR